MNILFLTSRFPFPPIGGDRLRPYWFIKGLSKRHRIHLLSFAEEGEINCVDEDIKNRIKISTVKYSPFISFLKTARNILEREPLQVGYYYYKCMQEKIETIIKQEKIDLVFVHLIRMAKYVKHLQRVNKIIDYSDSFGLLYARSYKIRKWIFKLIDYIEKTRTNPFEKECLTYFNTTIISSSIDKKWIGANSNNRIHIITNGIDIPSKMNFNGKIQNSIAFLGNMRSFANRYAIKNFIKNIFPIVKKNIEDVKLFVIGASPSKFLNRFPKNKNIYITGKVNDIDMHLEKCSISIAPMITCAGVQNKILKYMSLRLPTVATTDALGGLGAVRGKDIIVCDSREDFAKEIISLLQNKPKRDSIGENGYKYAATNHNWENIIEELDKVLQSHRRRAPKEVGI